MFRLGPMVSLFLCLLWGVPQVYAGSGAESATASLTAEALYSQLRSVGLDPSRVYRIREASLDRSAVHISFDDGTIAFTQDVCGRITGAFFEGEGEVLLAPPNHAERSSMALFTGMAILEEQFFTGYFRFNDDVFAELKPWLRPIDNAQEFVSRWDGTARRLAEFDALRLLVSFSRLLPASGQNTPPVPEQKVSTAADRMLHARLQGRKLGTFDVLFDTTVPENVWAGQTRSTSEGIIYYDLWTSFAAGQPASRAGKSAESRDRVIISQYKIRADVNPPTELIGDARLQLEVKQGGERTMLFELSRFLHVKSVEVNGRAAEFINNQALEGSQLEKRGNDLVAVVFPTMLKTGDKLELRVVYAGEVLSEAGKGLLYVGARGMWYPNRGMAMSNFDLEFHYPPGWTLLATGKRMPLTAPISSVSDRLDSQETPPEQTARWVSERPIPIAGFNLGKYARAVAHAGDVTVESYATAGVERNFPRATEEVLPMPDPRHPLPSPTAPPLSITVPPPSPARNAQPVADQSAHAIEFYSRLFGPFPYGSLELTQMPGQMSQGWPGLVFLSSFAFLTPAERKELRMSRREALLDAQVLAHETAHQWWGDLVCWYSYRDQWVVEALANYSSMMLLESQNPVEFRELMAKFRQDLQQKNKEGQRLIDAGPVTLGSRLSASHFPNGYDVISYGRGTWLLHMLREMLRDAQTQNAHRGVRSSRLEDEPFVRSLRKLREHYAGKMMTTREFLQVFEEELPPSLRYEGHKSLDWFLDSWINGTAMPEFELTGVKYTEKDGLTSVSGTVLQKDAPDTLVTSIPLYASLPGKMPVLLGRIFADGPESTFRLSAPSGTHKLLLDPYQTVLSNPR